MKKFILRSKNKYRIKTILYIAKQLYICCCYCFIPAGREKRTLSVLCFVLMLLTGRECKC